MSFQAYLDNVQKKTGKTPAEFVQLAKQKGLSKHGDIVRWLKSDFELGHGHATAIAGVILKAGSPPKSSDQKMNGLFSGAKSSWRAPCDALMAKIAKFGTDVQITAGSTYVSLLRGKKKFGILLPASASRLDVGIKLKNKAPVGRFEAAGNWNTMVTHRVRITDADQLDTELLTWLKQAYAAQV